MMQAHINNGMNEEELIQQVFISMYVCYHIVNFKGNSHR
jgi:hypothetical protein